MTKPAIHGIIFPGTMTARIKGQSKGGIYRSRSGVQTNDEMLAEGAAKGRCKMSLLSAVLNQIGEVIHIVLINASYIEALIDFFCGKLRSKSIGNRNK